MNNYTIFDLLYPKYKITKKIRLIELFAGYGSQALALKYLNVEFEHWKICEWAVKSIQAYNDLHIQDYTDYSKNLTDEEILNLLVDYGVSINYNNPATKDQLKRQKFRTIYNNIIATNNLVNIQRVKGSDLEISQINMYDYILTYSFPCQDLSLAGKCQGMSDTTTRSGMLWEVDRILSECKTLGTLPQILLMENVPQVHSQENVQDFNKWQLKLEELGYQNYFKDLIATDYGIPQTRNRCFMVSILGEYNYSFPQPTPLEFKLKDLLEENVDEKYYLSDKFIECMTREKVGGYPRKERFEQSINNVKNNNVANTITTKEGSRDISTFIKIKNNTKKGYQEAKIGDCIDFTQPNSTTRRGRVQTDKIQTLTTQNNLGVVVDKPKVLGGFGKIGSTGQFHQQNRVYSDNLAISVTTAFNPYYQKDLHIRKLTPKECFRLMGVKDSDFEKISKKQSDSSLYHLAGDSIVVDVLMAIFKELL